MVKYGVYNNTLILRIYNTILVNLIYWSYYCSASIIRPPRLKAHPLFLFWPQSLAEGTLHLRTRCMGLLRMSSIMSPPLLLHYVNVQIWWAYWWDTTVLLSKTHTMTYHSTHSPWYKQLSIVVLWWVHDPPIYWPALTLTCVNGLQLYPPYLREGLEQFFVYTTVHLNDFHWRVVHTV